MLNPTRGECFFASLPSLSFWGKIVERVLSSQLQRALDEVDHLDLFQSSFRLGLSIKTALVMLVDDLWRAWNGSGASVLILLDLSAFNILLDWLRGLGVGVLWWWLSSYLDTHWEWKRDLTLGVCFFEPQHSTLSLFLFNCCLTSIWGKISLCGCYPVVHFCPKLCK